MDFVKHCQFKNYYYALTYLYVTIKQINTPHDLDGIEMLFIGDNFYSKHKAILNQKGFIETCNNNRIRVVIFVSEKIVTEIFPEAELEFYLLLNKINDLHCYTYDIDDCAKYGTKLHRLCMSRHYKDSIDPNLQGKSDKIIFLGSKDGEFYKDRRNTIFQMMDIMDVDVIKPNGRTWEAYMSILSSYRFVLSPMGNANALVTRFYETLLVRSIPVQQLKNNTLNYYDIESGFNDCIYFQDVKELPDKIKNFSLEHSYSEIWLEDYLSKLLKEDGLL